MYKKNFINIGLYFYIKKKFEWLLIFKKTFSNYLFVVLNLYLNNFPIKGILKNGTIISFESKEKLDLNLIQHQYPNFIYNENEDSVIISNDKSNFKKITLYGVSKNLDSIITFHEKIYQNLPVKNKIVFDIGACNGDTSIYFAIFGASKIIAIEPFPNNFQLLKKNILINKLEKIIIPKLSGCSSKNNTVKLQPNEGNMRSTISNSQEGEIIDLENLESIIKNENFNDGILKLDCEGCEYDAILDSSREILRKFSHIQIEYHNGYNNIKKKLENDGFFVKIIKIDSYKMGHLIAIRF